MIRDRALIVLSPGAPKAVGDLTAREAIHLLTALSDLGHDGSIYRREPTAPTGWIETHGTASFSTSLKEPQTLLKAFQ